MTKETDNRKTEGVAPISYIELVRCDRCKFWKRDVEYTTMGGCSCEDANSRIVTEYCDMFLIADDYGCKFFEAPNAKLTP